MEIDDKPVPLVWRPTWSSSMLVLLLFGIWTAFIFTYAQSQSFKQMYLVKAENELVQNYYGTDPTEHVDVTDEVSKMGGVPPTTIAPMKTKKQRYKR